jgi:hypothetical protein
MQNPNKNSEPNSDDQQFIQIGREGCCCLLNPKKIVYVSRIKPRTMTKGDTRCYFDIYMSHVKKPMTMICNELKDCIEQYNKLAALKK